MNNDYIFAFLGGLFISLALAPFVIGVSKKFKLKQTILHYVDNHIGKQGTPTMGGIIFILGTLISSLFFIGKDFTLAIVALAAMLSYGLLGFLDDFIKIRFKQNEGLKPYQKIIGQVGIATILGIFCYMSPLIGTSIEFFNLSFDIGFFIIPFAILVFLAVTNSVNLLDGLDGLCSGVSAVYLFGFSSIIIITSPGIEVQNLLICSFALIGSLIAFLCFNVNPAKIFMGDTGSLAIGGFIAALGLFTRNPFLIPILGIVYVITALSDIIQVLYYKKTKKRIFLMAPLHHHFERKGVAENHIVFRYSVLTMVLCVLVYIIQQIVL